MSRKAPADLGLRVGLRTGSGPIGISGRIMLQGPADGLVFIPVEGRKSLLIGYLLMAAGHGEALVVDAPRGAS